MAEFNRITSKIYIGVRELIEFTMRAGDIDLRLGGFIGSADYYNAAREGSLMHEILQRKAVKNVSAEGQYTAEVDLSIDVGDFSISGRADGVIFENGFYTIEEIKTTGSPLFYVHENDNPMHWAQAIFYAYMFSVMNGLDGIDIKLTYAERKTGETVSYTRSYDRDELEKFVFTILERYRIFADFVRERGTVGIDALRKMRFPFCDVRGGQRDFVLEAFRTIKNKKRLLVTAPTGIGKTMASLYPAVKTMGEGMTSKIFMLTAKTVTGIAALDAAKILSAQAPLLKCIMIVSRERSCPFYSGNDGQYRISQKCNPADCIRADGHYNRVNEAIAELLMSYNIYTREVICETAAKYQLCPYELSLDLSEWCDIVIADYNYLFDPKVKLKRYFDSSAVNGENYVFLIDEAHNLPDRAREMYSTSIKKSSFDELAAMSKSEIPRIHNAAEEISEKLASLIELCGDDITHDAEGNPCGFYMNNQIPAGLCDVFEKFIDDCDDYFKNGENTADISEYYYMAREFIDTAARFDRRFTLYIEFNGDEVMCRLLCLDPSHLLDSSMKLGRASILFSATLTPIDYFRDILGCEKSGTVLELPSPYHRENLCIAAFDKISTRYADRESTAYDIADIIYAAAEPKSGNYIVYFPSYKYMMSVASCFHEMYPNIRLNIQKPSMSEKSKESFLAAFNKISDRRTMIGFCVLGGSFSEGIDLIGEKLIGAIIVGVGLSAINTETNIIRDYYESTRENGFEYAYVYPGMNRVLQAAGRVIRSEDDRGIIVLVDDRFSLPVYRDLFPEHWSHLKYVGNKKSLQKLIRDFWK